MPGLIQRGCCCCKGCLKSGADVWARSRCDLFGVCGGQPAIIESDYGDQARDLRVCRQYGIRIKDGSIEQVIPVDAPRGWKALTQKSRTDPWDVDDGGGVYLESIFFDALVWKDFQPDGATYKTRPRVFRMDSAGSFTGQDIPPYAASGRSHWRYGWQSQNGTGVYIGTNSSLGIRWYLYQLGFAMTEPLTGVTTGAYTIGGTGGKLGVFPWLTGYAEFRGLIDGYPGPGAGPIWQWNYTGESAPHAAAVMLNFGGGMCSVGIPSDPIVWCWRIPSGALWPNNQIPNYCSVCDDGMIQLTGPQYRNERSIIDAGQNNGDGLTDLDIPEWGVNVGPSVSGLNEDGWVKCQVRLSMVCDA